MHKETKINVLILFRSYGYIVFLYIYSLAYYLVFQSPFNLSTFKQCLSQMVLNYNNKWDKISVYILTFPRKLNFDLMSDCPILTDVTHEEGQYYGYVQLYLQFINYPYLVSNISKASIIFLPFFWTYFIIHHDRPHLQLFLRFFRSLSVRYFRDDQIIFVPHMHINDDDLLKMQIDKCKKCVFGILNTHKIYSEIVLPYYTGFPQFPPLIAEQMSIKRDLFFVCIMGVDKNQHRIALYKTLNDYISKNSQDKSILINLNKLPSLKVKSEVLGQLPYYYSRSIFNIVPIGHVSTSKRFYDAITYGSIPVVYAPEYEFAFSDFINYSEFVIYIHPNRVEDIPSILLNYSKQPNLIKKMQNAAKNAAKKFKWHSEIPIPGEGLDTLLKQLKYHYIDKKPSIQENIPFQYK